MLTISGYDRDRVFDIPEGSTVTIAGLTISHGLGHSPSNDRGAGGGGGILNAGNLMIANAVLSYNVGITHGGAIANAPFGVLTVVNSTFIGNQAVSKDPAAITEGGAIYNSNRGSVATVLGSTFINNLGIGGDGGVLGADGGIVGQCNGGAIHNGLASVLTVESSTFMGNQVMGGNSNSAISAGFAIAGGAIGGAIANDENCDGGALFVRGCTFADNQALGGSNNLGSFNGSGAAGHGGGGAIYQGGAGTIADSTFIGNQAVGGCGNTAGTSWATATRSRSDTMPLHSPATTTGKWR